MAAKFELYKDKKGEYRWKLLATNGQVIAVGEGYTSKTSAVKGIESVKKNAPTAKISEK
ncbi:MAG: YegP family protein [Dehalococcoidia bacterium]